MAKVPRDTRLAVWQRDQWRCRYCKRSVLKPSDDAPEYLWATIDHVTPRAKGGSNKPSNLVTSCKPCNAAKGSHSAEAYRAGHVDRLRPATALKMGWR